MANMGLLIGLAIGGVIVLVLVIWFIAGYNSFVKMRNAVEEAFSSMDIYLKKRYDLIPNLVETVKGYAKHESSTLEQVIAARNAASSSSSAEERIQNDNFLQGALRSLFAVAEAYPDLKANIGFLDLQRQLQSIETEIEKSRRYYNAVANRFNVKTETFPSNLLASIFHFQRKPLYEVTDAAQRENVQVQF